MVGTTVAVAVAAAEAAKKIPTKTSAYPSGQALVCIIGRANLQRIVEIYRKTQEHSFCGIILSSFVCVTTEYAGRIRNQGLLGILAVVAWHSPPL